jgi:hypothetical protein
MKAEIIKALQDFEIRMDWFEYDGSIHSSIKQSYQIKTDNYWIDIEIEVTVEWESLDFYELYNIELLDFVVTNENDTLIDETNFHDYFKKEYEITDELNIEI